ncbi:MAG TPA: hypothetical protein VFJ12_15880 [Segeticoccus sp.]|jgi:hypothetical protein|nr:hypothetical protein [Segeticoccus sp.]
MPETEPLPCELSACPLCGQAAEVVWRADLPSTDGPLPHVKIQCVQRHWFVGPEQTLAPRPERVDGALAVG